MLNISSPAFTEGATLPVKFAKDGENLSPQLEWSGVPEGTRELALVCDDPDAPNGTFTHWIIYGLDPSVTALPEGLPRRAQIKSPVNARQGMNSAGKLGYIGPYPPTEDDWHHYRFKLFALKHNLGLSPKVSEEEFYSAIEDNIVEMAELTGKYHPIKRLSETPAYKLTRGPRAKLRRLATRGTNIAARISATAVSALPAKSIIAIGLAAVAGGVVAYLSARPQRS